MKTLILILSLLAASSSVFCKPERPPNIILIMADDVSWECFSCYGAEDYHTPHIDSLASKGIRFDHCYSTPICTPSRVKLMTGQYNFRNYTHFGYLNPKDRTFAHLLKGAGYKTAIAGKWQLNGLYHGAEGNQDNTRPYQAGFDEYCLWQLTTGKTGKLGGERFWSPPLEQNGKFLTKEDNHELYGPDIMSDFLCDFMERNMDEPFFVYYPMVLVHDPFVPTPDSIGSRSKTHETNKQPKDKDEQKENFVAMVHYMDKIIGKIVDKVEAIGQLENTIIMFTADNGTNVRITSRWNGQEIKGGKGSPKDTGNHVPFVAYWKGHTPKGAVVKDLVDFTDFYTTIAEAAGIKLGKADPIDGRSFLAQLQGKKGQPRDWVLSHYNPYWGKFPGSQHVRDAKYKLYRDGRFYNVPNDLEEENDLAAGSIKRRVKRAHNQLAEVMETVPPAPPLEGGKEVVDRPIHPDWPNIVDPND